jgi:hypothetical protein
MKPSLIWCQNVCKKQTLSAVKHGSFPLAGSQQEYFLKHTK